jgi:hypothetical protein
MITTFFLAFVALMAVLVIEVGAHYLDRRTASIYLSGLFAWLIYVGLISYFGVVRNTTMRPPGVAFLFLPIVVFFAVLVARAKSPAVERLALALPLWLILATQTFRVGVELFLHQLWIDGLIPRMLTFAGANVDIYVGATAPIAAWLSTRGRSSMKVVLVWNILGILALANIVARAVLTAPGPLNLIHAEAPNCMIGTFPFTFIPGFFVPLALLLHILALRSAFSRLHATESALEARH